MQVKMWYKFLQVDYVTELYKNFHSLKQIGALVEEQTLRLDNLSIQVNLNESYRFKSQWG